MYDLTGAGKTVVKFNYGTFWWNPGTSIASDVNQNPAEWYRRHNWSDPNRNGVYDPGEEGTLIASQGGLGSAVLELRGGMAHVVVDNTIALIEGRPPVSCLNPEVLKKLF